MDYIILKYILILFFCFIVLPLLLMIFLFYGGPKKYIEGYKLYEDCPSDYKFAKILQMTLPVLFVIVLLIMNVKETIKDNIKRRN